MTISSTDSRISANGNGVTTVFAFNYYFLASADLVVVARITATGVESTKALTTDYTVSGAGSASGGQVTMLTAPASGTTLTIYRSPAQTQDLDLVENDPMPAEEIEKRLDKLTMIDQRLSDRLNRTVRLTDGYAAAFDTKLPAVLTASSVVVVNAGVTGFEMGPSTATISGATVSAAEAAASAASAATSATNAATSATNAATSATNSATSATSSASSATSSAASATAAAAEVATHAALTATHGATGAIMGTTNTQTVTNKSISGTTNTLTDIPLASAVTGFLPAGSMPALTGEATTVAGAVAVTLTNSAVIGKVMTGYVSGAGTVAATDSILQAIQKLNGNAAAGSTLAVATKTGAYTITSADAVILANATTAFTLTLPDASANSGKVFHIKHIGTNGIAVTIARAGSDLIDGETSQAISATHTNLTLVSDGSAAWHIL